MRDDGLRVYGPGDFLCIGCGFPDDLCTCVDEGWDEVEERRESAIHRDDARFYEEDS